MPTGGTIKVNGIAGTVNGRDWSATIPVATDRYVTPVEAKYTTTTGVVYEDRQAVIHGPRLDEGQYSNDGVGMRFTNTGLTNLGPVIQDLASGAFDISGLLLAQNPLFNQQDALLTIDATGNAYEAGIGGVNLTASSTDAGVATNIAIEDLFVGVDMHLTDGLSDQHRLPTRTADPAHHDRRDLRPRTAGVVSLERRREPGRYASGHDQRGQLRVHLRHL